MRINVLAFVLLASCAEPLAEVSSAHSRQALSFDTFDFRFNSPAREIGRTVGLASDGTRAFFLERNTLWVTDGTATGTRAVKRLRPDEAQVLALNSGDAIRVHDGRAWFVIDDGSYGLELWKSDGTPSGTVRVTDCSLGAGHGFAEEQPVLFGQTAVLAGYCGNVDRRAYAVNLVTGQVTLLAMAPGVSGVTPFGNGAVFSALDGASQVLHFTDGTVAGTRSLGVPVTRVSAASAGTRLVFAGGGANSEPWVTDGTVAGTRLLREIRPGTTGSNPTTFVSAAGRAFFIADDGVNGRELWASDGVTAWMSGVTPGTADPFPTEYVNALSVKPVESGGNLFYFFADGRLWALGGADGGVRTQVLTSVDSNRELMAAGDAVFLRTGPSELSRIDRSLAVSPIAEISSNPYVAGLDGSVLLGARATASDGGEFGLWRIDSPDAGPQPLFELSSPIESERIGRPVPWGTGVAVPFYNSGQYAGFVDEAGSAGNAQVGTGYGDPSLFLLDDQLIAVSDQAVRRVLGDGGLVWLAPGLTQNTRNVRQVGQTLFLGAGGSGHDAGDELWAVDRNGARRLTDLRPGPTGSNIKQFVDDGTSLFFLGTTQNAQGVSQQVFWSDGTRVQQVTSSSIGFFRTRFFSGAGRVFLASTFWDLSTLRREGDGGFVTATVGFPPAQARLGGDRDLTDGVILDSPNGAVMAGTLDWQGDPFADSSWKPRETELYSVPRSGAPVLLRDFSTLVSSEPRDLVASGNMVFFSAVEAGRGRELYAGRRSSLFASAELGDLNPGPEGSFAGPMASVSVDGGALVVFGATDGVSGVELWRADALHQPTRLLDVWPGDGSSMPRDFVTSNGWLYFTAADPANGRKLRRVRLAVVNDYVAPSITCPAGVRQVSAPGGAVISWPAPITLDDVSTSLEVSSSSDAGSLFPLGVTAVTLRASDEAGNSSTCTFEVNLQPDTTAPATTCPADVVTADGSSVTWPQGTATDDVGVVSVSDVPASGSQFPEGVTTVTRTALDATGNAGICTFSVTVTAPPRDGGGSGGGDGGGSGGGGEAAGGGSGTGGGAGGGGEPLTGGGTGSSVDAGPETPTLPRPCGCSAAPALSGLALFTLLRRRRWAVASQT